MKKNIQVLAILFAVLCLWVVVFTKYFSFQVDFVQMYLAIFLLAPLSEELFFRVMFYRIGKRFNIVAEMGLLSTALFIMYHFGNYDGEPAKVYLACFYQGTMGFLAYYAMKNIGYLGAVGVHISYNLFVTFLLPLLA